MNVLEKLGGGEVLQICFLIVAWPTIWVGALEYIFVYKNVFCIGDKSLNAMGLSFFFDILWYTLKKRGQIMS